MSLVTRLYLLVILAVAPAIAVLYLDAVQERRERTVRAEEEALRAARLLAGELDRVFAGVRGLLVAVSRTPSVRAGDRATCGRFVADLLPAYEDLARITVFDADGRPRCRDAPAPPNLSVADRPYFRAALAADGLAIGGHTVMRGGDEDDGAVVPLALRFAGPDGRPAGVAAAALRVDWLRRQLAAKRLPPGSSITVADDDGVILVRLPDEGYEGRPLPPQWQWLAKASGEGVARSTAESAADGVARLIGYVGGGLPPAGLVVAVGLPEAWALAGLREATFRGLAAMLVVAAAALVAADLGGRWFVSRPVGALLDAVERWRAGDLAARTGLRRGGGSELGRLGAAFDEMAEALAARETALRQSEARLHAVVESLPFDFWVCDRDGRYVMQNSTSRANWGDRRGLRPEDTDTPPEVLAGWLENNRRALAGELIRKEEDHRGGGGRRRHVDKILAPIRDGDAVLGVVGLNIDISARKAAEEQQAVLLAELSHRVKNTLAVIQAIASRTAGSASDLPGFLAAFRGRLRALAAAHDLLAATGWRRAGLRDLAQAALAPHSGEGRIALALPDAPLPPSAAQTLVLALHELATNAAKHGALSTPDGRVALAGAEAPGGWLELTWTEAGGPPVPGPPARTGFGVTLLTRALAHQHGAEVVLDWRPGGLVCAVRLRLEDRGDGGEAEHPARAA